MIHDPTHSMGDRIRYALWGERYTGVSAALHAAFLLLAATYPVDFNDPLEELNAAVFTRVVLIQTDDFAPETLAQDLRDLPEDPECAPMIDVAGGGGTAGETTIPMEPDSKKAVDDALSDLGDALDGLGGGLDDFGCDGQGSVGSDALYALGNLGGPSFGEARGFGGLGMHGRGGGGISERGIGLANVGTAGRGGGRGGGYGRGAGDLNGRRLGRRGWWCKETPVEEKAGVLRRTRVRSAEVCDGDECLTFSPHKVNRQLPDLGTCDVEESTWKVTIVGDRAVVATVQKGKYNACLHRQLLDVRLRLGDGPRQLQLRIAR